MRTGKVTTACLVAAIFAAPFIAVAQEITFTKLKLLVQEGDKSKERDVALVYADGKIVIKERNKPNRKRRGALRNAETQLWEWTAQDYEGVLSPVIYEEIQYSAITNVTYERSRRRFTTTLENSDPVALFSRGNQHWLTITYQDGEKSSYALLKLDRKEYQRIIAVTETEVGVKVERVIE